MKLLVKQVVRQSEVIVQKVIYLENTLHMEETNPSSMIIRYITFTTFTKKPKKKFKTKVFLIQYIKQDKWSLYFCSLPNPSQTYSRTPPPIPSKDLGN